MKGGCQIMIAWQIAEYSSLFPLSFKIIRSNFNRHEITTEIINFGTEKHQYVLYFKPFASVQPKNQIIIHIHGGGWRMGSPKQFSFIGRSFARHGYHTLMLGYRLAPKFKFPNQLDDISQGLISTISFLNSRNINCNRIILGGQSSGAQLAALVAHNANEFIRNSHDKYRIRGTYLISGPLDFSCCQNKTIRKLVNDYIDNDENKYKANPINYINQNESINTFLIHGTNDPLIDISATQSFYNKSNKRNTFFYKVKGAHHSDLVGMFLDHNNAAAIELLRWIDDSE
jgi:acetyl esterase/lipase